MNTHYRGYWIKTNPMNGLIWIEADGFHIAYAKSIEHARHLIDGLTD